MAMSGLPESFLSDMQELLGEEYPAFLSCFEERPLSGLRVNTLKIAPEEAAELLGLTDPVPWAPPGFYLPEEKGLTRHPFYYAGLYYIQEPSAMSSASLLGTRPGERILDLCAAPGGKSTQIGADLKGQGLLVSNDLSSSRAKALLKNIELMGIGNAVLTCEESGRLKAAYPGFFDRILVDAPCSGEGMFRKHPAVIRAYLEHGRDFYCPVQAMLLDDAAEMLRPGGTLVYSTCTYNRKEDEDQITAFLSRHPDFTPDLPALSPGLTPSSLQEGCVRLFPHHAKAEGHFVARLKKTGPEEGFQAYAGAAAGSRKEGETRAFLKAAESFLSSVKLPLDPGRILVQGEYVSYLPDVDCLRPGLRYLRTGLLLGQLKSGRFKPSQALAMFLTGSAFEAPVALDSEDPRVLRYLKGETIESDSGEKQTESGYRLLLCGRWPLGFVKQDRNRLKNMYLPGWRMM